MRTPGMYPENIKYWQCIIENSEQGALLLNQCIERLLYYIRKQFSDKNRMWRKYCTGIGLHVLSNDYPVYMVSISNSFYLSCYNQLECVISFAWLSACTGYIVVTNDMYRLEANLQWKCPGSLLTCKIPYRILFGPTNTYK